MRKFKDELFAKAKLGEVDLNNDCLMASQNLEVGERQSASHKGIVTDQFIEDLEDQW